MARNGIFSSIRILHDQRMTSMLYDFQVGSELSTASTIDERKYCMLEYAMLYFRQSPFRYLSLLFSLIAVVDCA